MREHIATPQQHEILNINVRIDQKVEIMVIEKFFIFFGAGVL